MSRPAAIPRGWALGLKFTRANGETDGRDGRPVFVWPLTPGAMVTAPDWQPDPSCGGGLHFWPDGVGDVGACDYHATAVHGLVIAYPPAKAVAFDGKAKTARAKIIFAGMPREAATWLAARRPGMPIVYATATAGDRGIANAGYRGIANAGYRGTATAGNYGTATAGNYGTATAGDRGTANAGYRGTATAGNYGTATAGNYGTATAGNYGTANAGNYGTATAGDRGIANAGYGGAIVILWWNGTCYRRRCAEVDGVTIKANTPYRLDAAGKFVAVVK